METFPQTIRYTIYTLYDPIEKTIFYVGRTTRTIEQRLKEHCYASAKICKPCSKRIKNLHDNGRLPIIEALEVLTFLEMCKDNKRERYWIWQFQQWGFKLDNLDFSKPSLNKHWKIVFGKRNRYSKIF